MQLKVIEVTARKGNADTIVAIAEKMEAVDCQVIDLPQQDRECVRILTGRSDRQPIVDQLESLLGGGEDWRVSILPVDGSLPQVEPSDEEKTRESQKALTATREELYGSVANGADLNINFLLLIVLSTLVAGIGLKTDNVAVVIGAMVIAPLLGPNLAFALATSLGDGALMARALRTNVVGVGLAVGLCAAFSALVDIPLDSAELMMRTHVGADGIVLALASGAAAALSLTTGLSTNLVGVMVAVALLPPAATAGLMAGEGRWEEATGAAILLGVNIICVNLAAQVVFLWKGIRPRGWLERENARQSWRLNLIVWVVLLAAAIALIRLRGW